MNWRFFLKETGISKIINSKLVTYISTKLLAFYLWFIWLNYSFGSYYPFENMEMKNVLYSFLFLGISVIVSLFILFLIYTFFDITIEYLRRNFPYEVNKVIENRKEYIVKNFHYQGIIKYYHKGLLHRELGAAVYNQFWDQNYFYLFGEKVEEQNIAEIIKQNNIKNFN